MVLSTDLKTSAPSKRTISVDFNLIDETFAEAKAELPMDRKVPGKDNVPVIGHA